jgi:hypothetical protein
MNQEMSKEVIAALSGAGLEFHEGRLYMPDADYIVNDATAMDVLDDATAATVKFHAVAIAQAFPAAEVRSRLVEALEGVRWELQDVIDDLYIGTPEWAEEVCEQAECDRETDALKRQQAGQVLPVEDVAFLAERDARFEAALEAGRMRRDHAADNAELAARGIVLGAPLIDLATDPAGPIKNPVLDVHTCVPA